jgi:F-type H+-transporting ATPase subunit b
VLPYLPIAQVVIPWRIEHPAILWSMLIGFALLLLLVLRVPIPFLSVPHYKVVLDERATRIETNKHQVDTAIGEVQQLRNDYAARLGRIEEEARQRIDAAVREADAARAEIIAEAEQVAHAIRRRGEEEIARERTRQRILFRQQIVKTAMDSAEGAIRDHTDDSVQRRLIGDFIAQAAGDGTAPSNPRQEGA